MEIGTYDVMGVMKGIRLNELNSMTTGWINGFIIGINIGNSTIQTPEVTVLDLGLD